ncbi:MAG: general secretion pathway protein GspB [Candidatus Omnitrophota bacterium]
MDKEKREKIILAIIIPIFLIGLGYSFMHGRTKSQDAGTDGINIIEKEQEMGLHAQADAEISIPDGILEVKYEGSGKDPLKDLMQEYLKTQKYEEPKLVMGEMPLPDLKIQGLLWKSDMPQVIVNGQVLKLGDTIEGVKISDIKKEGITVEHGGRSVFIKK